MHIVSLIKYLMYMFNSHRSVKCISLSKPTKIFLQDNRHIYFHAGGKEKKQDNERQMMKKNDHHYVRI